LRNSKRNCKPSRHHPKKKINFVGQIGTSTDIWTSLISKDSKANGSDLQAIRIIMTKPTARIAVSKLSCHLQGKIFRTAVGIFHLYVGQAEEYDAGKNQLSDLQCTVNGTIKHISPCDIGTDEEHVKKDQCPAEKS
jgi:hypothetical protein